jgi:hypothetical protein
VSEVSWYIPEFNSVNSSKSRKYECDGDRPRERVSVFKMGPTDQERKSLRDAQLDIIDKCEKALPPPAVSIALEEVSFKTPYAMFRCKSPLRNTRKKHLPDVDLTAFDSVEIDTNAAYIDTGASDHLN